MNKGFRCTEVTDVITQDSWQVGEKSFQYLECHYWQSYVPNSQISIEHGIMRKCDLYVRVILNVYTYFINLNPELYQTRSWFL